MLFLILVPVEFLWNFGIPQALAVVGATALLVISFGPYSATDVLEYVVAERNYIIEYTVKTCVNPVEYSSFFAIIEANAVIIHAWEIHATLIFILP